MTPEERLKTLKAGDQVTIAGAVDPFPRTVLLVAADGVLVTDTGSVCASSPLWYPASRILWPDPPKALPGRRYRYAAGLTSGVFTSDDIAVGLVSGRLAVGSMSFDFDPTKWELLPED